MESLAIGEYSPQMLLEMRSASRSPNKRSVNGARCIDEQEKLEQEDEAPGRRQESSSGACAALVAGVPPTVTPFKRFRADSLISPRKSSSGGSSGGAASGLNGLFARRRAVPAFQSLSKDHSARTMHAKSRAVAVDSEADTDRSTQDSSQHSSQQDTQQSSQGLSVFIKTRDNSPSDVAALCSELLVCSETLEDQMDALDVGSFLSWRPAPPQDGERESTVLQHRRKPRIRFDGNASYDIGLQEVFGDESTQLDDDPTPLPLLPPPVVVVRCGAANGGGDSCCMCADGHEDDDADVERLWQVYSPPPCLGFDPTCCSPNDSDLDSDDDTVNESPFDSL